MKQSPRFNILCFLGSSYEGRFRSEGIEARCGLETGFTGRPCGLGVLVRLGFGAVVLEGVRGLSRLARASIL